MKVEKNNTILHNAVYIKNESFAIDIFIAKPPIAYSGFSLYPTGFSEKHLAFSTSKETKLRLKSFFHPSLALKILKSKEERL